MFLNLKYHQAVKHAALLKKFLVSIGTWENPGNSNGAFESAVYTKISLPVDDDYFKLDSSISVDIEHFYVEYDDIGVEHKHVNKIDEFHAFNNASFLSY
ncbi:unnamed protein product [Meloidogyne enterolobii]|uniref:Uncharacterized protein n=1 Tax=Meloidogyne enterolobii TaxID=390850 RepID=A0ACB1AJ90_MELEN